MTPESARTSRSPLRLAASIPFALIPGQSRLFLDYLDDPASLRGFYPNTVQDPLELGAFAPEVLASYATDRQALSDALSRYNIAAGSGQATAANIEMLRRPDTVAVVTGQQAGLFTGPLYTIYKALSAIALAERLSRNGVVAIPVFWVASEDHDLDEIDHVELLRSSDGLGSVSYRPQKLVEGCSVGDIRFDAAVSGAIDTLFDDLPKTEFSEALKGLCALSYLPGENYGTAFARLILQLLGHKGLVVIDPLDPAIKRLASRIYSAAIERSDEIVAAIHGRSRDLDAAGYHAQVLVEPDYFPLFWHDEDGRRLALKHTGDGMFRVKGEKLQLHRDQLLSAAKTEPHRLSPGVMLRSVVQDYLLPTICYYGGGAEIAYFAQNSEAYRVLERPVTPILHRQGFTLVEPRERRNMERFGWELEDLFRGKDAAVLEAAKQVDRSGLDATFAAAEQKIEAELSSIEQRLATTDQTLAASLDRRRSKIRFHLRTLRDKALRSQAARDGVTGNRIDTLFDALLPHGSLQERELNVLTFLNKYDLGLIDWIYECIDLDDKGHRILEF